MSMHPAHAAALEVAADPDNAHLTTTLAAGTRVLDTHSDDAPAYVIAMAESWAIVVYEDAPDTVVSAGSSPDRWLKWSNVK